MLREKAGFLGTAVLIAGLAACPCVTGAVQAGAGGQAAANSAQSAPASVMNAAEAAKMLPDQVFFRGQSATVQMRNSAGVRLADGMLILSVLVDTSGYSSSVQQRYQGYLINEVPIAIGERRLPPGEYGIGFVQGDRFVVMDVGAHDLLTTPSTHDAVLRRAMPLQILPSPEPGRYRLYFGRNYITFAPAH